MNNQPDVTLVHLSQSDLELADTKADVRGDKVVDSTGNEVGKVDDLVIDPDERKVRFLLLGAGGILGIGEQKFLIPIDAVTAVDETVHIDRNNPELANAPVYDPSLIEEQPTYYEDIYTHYGFPPYWTSGYVYPPFPYYRP